MHVTFSCSRCQHTGVATLTAETPRVDCPTCQHAQAVDHKAIDHDRPVRCPLCGCDDIWRQKDFPPRLGVAIVALGAILSSIAWSQYMPELAFGILLAFAAIDLLLYLFLPDVLVCYRCSARYRDVPHMERYEHFDLETAEKYRQEAGRKQDAR